MKVAGRGAGAGLGAHAKMAMKALFYGDISDLVPAVERLKRRGQADDSRNQAFRRINMN